MTFFNLKHHILKTIAVFSMLLLGFISFCQEESINSFQIISSEEHQSIVARSIDYRTSVFIVDSLYELYSASKFVIEEKTKSSYHDGLPFVLNLYSRARKLTNNSEYCDSMIAIIKIQLNEQMKAEVKNEYQKIKEKAEESYLIGDIDRAIELYERAVRLKPSDEQAKNRLKELNQL
ncbi:MAG: tetratricopeptide repeat protein [Crocinitomicaceae bacterium]